jgi:hypothetical protein
MGFIAQSCTKASESSVTEPKYGASMLYAEFFEQSY